ncbi:hypothetical protein VDGL01_10175 [Verticillium dahliae]
MHLSPPRDDDDGLPSDGNGTCIQAPPKQPATAGIRRPTADGEGSRSLHRPRPAWPRSNVLRHMRASQRGTAPRKAAEPVAAQSRCVDASICPPRCFVPGERLHVLNGRTDRQLRCACSCRHCCAMGASVSVEHRARKEC